MIKGRVHPKIEIALVCYFPLCRSENDADRKMSGDVFRSVPEFHRQKVFHPVPLMWDSTVAMYLDV